MNTENQIKLEEISDEYSAFVDKFKPKKTTDDCYTPQNIYDAIRDWVVNEYNIPNDAKIVRPFYPGGDYENFEYPEGCYVIDNPPFSILNKICRFYQKHGIRFFLFAQSLTSILNIDGVCAVVAACKITYENGAKVVTSFETNLEDGVVIRSAPALHDIVESVNKENIRKEKVQLPKYAYPIEVVHAARVQYYSVHGVDYVVRTSDAVYINALESQKRAGKTIFGGGYLLSERAAAERAAAERADVKIWELSDIEKEAIKYLNNRSKK